MKMFNKKYIKVRDAKVNETGWARLEKDKLFLDNDFDNYEAGQEIKINDENEIVWAGPTLEERARLLTKKRKTRNWLRIKILYALRLSAKTVSKALRQRQRLKESSLSLKTAQQEDGRRMLLKDILKNK